MPEVYVVKGGSPAQMAYDAVSQVFTEDPSALSVLLKVNTGFKGPAASGLCTHPEVVRGLIRFFKEKNTKRICVGDSSIVGVDSINIGDVYLMGCALAYAVQITLVDRLAGSLDGVRLNCIQFFVVAVLSFVVMLFAETPTWSGILACSTALLYTDILSSAVGFTLQILGQQRLAPEPAALIMSLESVFAVLAGWMILGQKLSLPETIGCCLVFAAVILSQRQSGAKQ